MAIGIGIDTGGTYTDAVAYDCSAGAVLAKGKALTTREDLTAGIGAAIDTIPRDLLERAELVALSTTLATNACVENKGCRAKLVLIGTSNKVLDWIGAELKYGLKSEDILCMDAHGTFDGKIVGEPDWETLFTDFDGWLRDADALSVAEVYAVRNGAVCEKKAKALFEERYRVPVVLGSELVSGLNVMERGATALLNARLLPVIGEFIAAVADVLEKRGINAPVLIVRSDGSLMTDQFSKMRPVETILSGPAASVLGGRALARRENCLIVDMGGTTTDISMIKGNVLAMADKGVRIGGWRTQVKGVFMDTFGLGGDSELLMQQDKLILGTRRVQPLCVAAARWPQIKKPLMRLLDNLSGHSKPIHEFLYLVREPRNPERYGEGETALLAALGSGPLPLEDAAKAAGADIYSLRSERLESEGVVMRCGLTPTDIMHIRGDFCRYDREASVLAARYFLRILPGYPDNEEGLYAFTENVYDLVKERLYSNIIRVLLADKYPGQFADGPEAQLQFLIAQGWAKRKERGPGFFELCFHTEATLIGIGAPTHVFLPDVARALGTECVIPEHAEVASAVGAIIADITAEARVEISPDYTADGIGGYVVHSPEGSRCCETLEEAGQMALRAAEIAARAEARRRGALGELTVQTHLAENISVSREGAAVDLGATATAVATGRVGV